MKKIVTLFTMLAVLVSVVSAQSEPEINDGHGPKINCQAVLRHHDAANNMDTLYHDQTVDVEVVIADGETPVYREFHNGLETDENGLITIPIGWGEPEEENSSILDVDWSAEFIGIYVSFDLGIAGEYPINILTQVRPMPYAIQANIGPITTEMIAHYSKYVITDDDMTLILDAIRNNPNGVKDGLKQWVIKYMKENMDIAKEVVVAYIPDFSPEEIHELYDALNTNPNKPELKQLLKQILIGSRDVAKDLAIWYMLTANGYDIQRTYQTFQAVPTATKQAAWTKLVEYMTSSSESRMPVYDFGLYLIENITAQEAGDAYQVLKEQNTVVKNRMRDTIDHYVDLYLADPANQDKVNVTPATVNNAVNHYLQEHPQIKKPEDCTIDICHDLKEPYDNVVEP
jgi:hypothetical protein